MTPVTPDMIRTALEVYSRTYLDKYSQMRVTLEAVAEDIKWLVQDRTVNAVLSVIDNMIRDLETIRDASPNQSVVNKAENKIEALLTASKRLKEEIAPKAVLMSRTARVARALASLDKCDPDSDETRRGVTKRAWEWRWDEAERLCMALFICNE